jgi:hypothetical protein
MNHHQEPLRQRSKNPAYRSAFARMDAALEENAPADNYEIIRLMRVACFADVEERMKSGNLILPKP